MLKFLFNRQAPVVWVLNAVCLLQILWIFGVTSWKNTSFDLGFAGYAIIVSWFIFNFLNLIRWYPGESQKVGIRLHFQKNLVPVIYITVLSLGLKLLGYRNAWLWTMLVLMIPMYYVVIILLGFHFRDMSKLRAGYFTQNYYLLDKEK